MGTLNHALQAAKRRWSHRQHFARLSDWSVTFYDSFVRYFSRLPMPGRGRVWQIRLSGKTVPVNVRLGLSDASVLEEIYISDVYQCVTSAGLERMGLILDLGANIGLSARLWAEVFAQAEVIAVEPDEANLEMCRRNLSHLGPRVLAVRACVAAENGTVFLNRSADACAYQMAHDNQAANSVPCDAKTVSQLLLDAGKQGWTIDLMKVDIEGAELEVFKSCRNWIGQVRNLMLELHSPYTAEQFLSDLDAAGSKLRVVDSRLVSGNPLIFLSVR